MNEDLKRKKTSRDKLKKEKYQETKMKKNFLHMLKKRKQTNKSINCLFFCYV